jgi:hypothetical protein
MTLKVIFGAVFATGLALATTAAAQRVLPGASLEGADLATIAAPAPFGPGEIATYRVSYGRIGRVGTGSMQVVGIDTVRGNPAYHVQFRLQGGIPGARVNNHFESWMDVGGLYSHRFLQDTHEVSFKRKRERNFFPRDRRWTGHTNDRIEDGTLPTELPLDDTSFLYFVRTMQLEVGREYTINRYWNPEGNPVRIRVLRRETVRVPAGTFNTIVVQPLIRTSGLFSEGGEAEVYFSDDDARTLVMLRAKLSIATLNLQLESFTPGRRLAATPFVPHAVGRP